MKTRQTIRKKNEGAALVSVLIGVLFISILASSLLYMATLNFQMKKMRYTSTDNFYTAEFALEEMLAQIREKTQVPDTDSTHTIHDELVELLDGGVDASTGFHVYKEDNLRNLIEIDGRKYGESGVPSGTPIVDGIEGIKVTNIYRNPDAADTPQVDNGAYTRSVYEEDGTSIKIYGLKVTVTTDEAHGNYESSVVVDLEYAFPEYASSGYSYGTPFGVLSDAPYQINSGNHVFTGPIYMASNNCKEDGNSYALYVGEDAVVNTISRSFFQGNVYVEKGSILFADDTYINGNLIIKSPGTVFVTGKVYIRGNISVVGGTDACVKCSGAGSVSENTPNEQVDWDHIDSEYGNGLAKCVAAENIHFYIDDTTGTVAGCGGNKSDLEVPMDMFQGSFYLQQDTGKKIVCSGTVDGKAVQAVYLRSTTTNGAGTSLDNSLVITHDQFHVQTPFTNCTFINISSNNNHYVEFESGLKAKTNIWGSMDRETFDAAKKLFFHCEIPKLNNTYDVKFPTSGNSNQITPKNTSGSELDEWVLNGTEKVYRYAIVNTKSGAPSQYYYRSDDGSVKTIYMPFGNLLSPDYGSIVDDFWGSCYVGGSSGGSGVGDKTATPTLLITHWTKE